MNTKLLKSNGYIIVINWNTDDNKASVTYFCENYNSFTQLNSESFGNLPKKVQDSIAWATEIFCDDNKLTLWSY